jgi:SAM-dependent methyltransferase
LKAGEFYNDVAGFYDEYYSDPDSKMENKAIQEILTPFLSKGDFIIDIGCGTGLFLELFNHIPMYYVGVDPSAEMLKHFERKFPHRPTFNLPYEKFDHYKLPRIAIGLFASPGYVSPAHLDPTEYMGHFLMFYRDGFRPGYYNRENPETKTYSVWDYNLSESNVYQFNDFEIATNWELKPHFLLKRIK